MAERTGLRAALTLACLGLAACGGFEPLYGDREGQPSTRELLRSVDVAPIAERTGQLLRIELVNLLRTGPEPAYSLDVSLSESQRNLAIQRDTRATRANLTVVADFALKRRGGDGGEALISGQVRSVNGYDILLQDYATAAAVSNARARAARDIAGALVDRIAAFLSNVGSQARAPDGR